MSRVHRAALILKVPRGVGSKSARFSAAFYVQPRSFSQDVTPEGFFGISLEVDCDVTC
jgi:hypothetical protein